MEILFQNVWLVPVFPLLSSVLSGLVLFFSPSSIGNSRRICSFISILFLTIAMFLSFHSFRQQITGSPIHQFFWSWITDKNIILEIGYLVDPLTSIMLILVTTVGVTVMIYSDSYMSHDQGYIRFFCYLSLFTASMLGLVPSPNLIQIYIFWELVGMRSYLLIGFWFTRPSAANACQKAFITNRIGDFGLLLGILGFYWITGSFEFQNLSERFFKLLDHNQINIIFANTCAILLFLGPIAKSAQFPLHIWLPDAMEGPTPISALIHAATMVAAGIFLVARMFPLFQMLPLVMGIISWIGVITALLGACIAITQRDLKRGLAYSTMSQLGYMILAPGMGSYKAGLFHLITHAYSKALLFLGSGSVIHSLEPIVGYHPNKSQNMLFMGGLRKHMPITALTFLSGTLSLCGIPPFACFWSKDEILIHSWSHFPLLGSIAFSTAGLTAFYMFRIYLPTFEGNFRGHLLYNKNKNSSSISIWGDNTIPDKIGQKEIKYPLPNKTVTKNLLYPTESDNIMLFPSIVPTIPTLFIGFTGEIFSEKEIDSDLLSNWLYLSMNSLNNIHSEKFTELLRNAIPSIIVSSTGIFIAFILYGSQFYNVERVLKSEKLEFFHFIPKSILLFVYNWSYHQGYINEFYNFLFARSLRSSTRYLSLMDQWLIDGIVNGAGILSFFGGEGLKYTEGGRISSYLFFLVSCMFLSFLYSYII
uniref:NAD(P)H-quinone oxidoreductase subunit 5, chloroplastic n=1 Tax=Gymnomitrion concinnatum TaxID=209793 RepID=A0A3G6XMT4_9MARC|nr:NADH-plastoquinone oxidoreductase subunit 5 [Gymnomitrion concinnatum]AZB86850.1 NADH-plastoquinone oxidoreductase subunit 5 [Gymnomitrion concinnatum]